MFKRSRSVRGEGSSSGRAREEYDPALQLPEYWPSIKITTADQRDRLINLYEREVVSYRWLHRESLQLLGLYDHMKHFLTKIGMQKFITMYYPTYRELTCEFLSSLNVVQVKSSPVMSFRLRNKNFTLTLYQFASIFELDPSPPNQLHAEYKADDIHIALTGKSCPNSQHISALSFHHPIPRIWQRFSGTCFLARHEPHNAQTNELAILGHYVYDYGSLNIACYIITQLNRHANSCTNKITTPVHCGGLITRIAVKKAGFTESRREGFTECGGQTFINLSYLQSLGWIRSSADDSHQWSVRVGREFKPIFTLPNPDLTAFPPGQGSYTYDHLLGQPQGVPQQPARVSPRASPRPPSPPQTHYMPPPPPVTGPETIWDMQSIGQALGRIESSQGDFRRMLGSLDQRLGYVERNQGRALFPMYDDYARRGATPDNAIYPDWYQPPPQGYVHPTSHGIYTDYSSFAGYGQDFPFGGFGEGYSNPFGGSSSGGAGGAGGSSRMDEDADD